MAESRAMDLQMSADQLGGTLDTTIGAYDGLSL